MAWVTRCSVDLPGLWVGGSSRGFVSNGAESRLRREARLDQGEVAAAIEPVLHRADVSMLMRTDKAAADVSLRPSLVLRGTRSATAILRGSGVRIVHIVGGRSPEVGRFRDDRDRLRLWKLWWFGTTGLMLCRVGAVQLPN
jgi:hypothetical protein